MRKLLTPLIALSLLYFSGCSKKSTEPNPPPTPSPRLIVDTVSVAPNMDSVDTPVWNLVDSVQVEIGGEQSTYGYDTDIGKIDVTLKAIKKAGTLFIYARWKDNIANLWGSYIRQTAQFGIWEHVTSEGEDKFFVLFDAGDNGTEKANCATMCHSTSMSTTGGGHADVWNWKSTSTDPGRLADDEWLSSTSLAFDAIYPGMYAYQSNWRPDQGEPYAPETPLMMHKTDTAFHGSVLYKEDAVIFRVDRAWKVPGDTMPGYIIDSTIHSITDGSAGSRWDVRVVSRHDNISTPHTWTVVFSRALYTGNNDDADLSGLDSVQVTIAAASDQSSDMTNYSWQHSGSKPFYIILKP